MGISNVALFGERELHSVSEPIGTITMIQLYSIKLSPIRTTASCDSRSNICVIVKISTRNQYAWGHCVIETERLPFDLVQWGKCFNLFKNRSLADALFLLEEQRSSWRRERFELVHPALIHMNESSRANNLQHTLVGDLYPELGHPSDVRLMDAAEAYYAIF